MQRRQLLRWAGIAASGPMAVPPARSADAAPSTASSVSNTSLAQALRQSGGVLIMRHALAPGTFDPPGFTLGDCSTQRNLSDEGRRQAQQIGAWFKAQRLRPAQVRSSPWCRCLETARLAFGPPVQVWDPLASPRGGSGAVEAVTLDLLRQRLATVVQQRQGWEAWVTHMFVIQALLGQGALAGEALLLGLNPDGSPRVVDRLVGSQSS